MRKQKKIVKYICMILSVILVLAISQNAYASELNADAKFNDYTEEYKEWLNLSDEEKAKVAAPKMYNTVEQEDSTTYVSKYSNVLKAAQLLKGTLSTRYSLKDIIANNVQIRNQKTTNTCWAFATIGSLESNLGLQDYKNSTTGRTYDFSERHMDYSSAYDAFLDSKTNSYGFSRTISSGGNFFYALSYLTNGMGAVDEDEMPFEDNQNNVDISTIQNKTQSATVLDTKEFATPTTDTEKSSLKTEMKEYISNYGGIYAGIYADTDYTSSTSSNINIITGAMYSTGKTINHAVCIIGWDDNYSKDNFNTKCQPTSNGAWIVKNSWGSAVTLSLDSAKALYYLQNTSECNKNGWYSASAVPDSVIITKLEATYGTGRVTVKDGTVSCEIGDNGYMYVSYEDTSIYSSLYGVDKSEYGKKYYKLYENDVLGETQTISVTAKQAYIANVFKRDSSVAEKLYRVSIYAPEKYTCKVLVNPNNSNKALSSMQEATLTTGSTVTIEPGFHTLELSSPVSLTGTSFVVAFELIASDTTNGSSMNIALERPDTTVAKSAVVNAGESFIGVNTDVTNESGWYDLKTTTISNEAVNGNVIIKAYTSSTSNVKTVEKIAITTYPTKRSYTQNKDSLDLTGGVLKVTYSDGTSESVSMTSSSVAALGYDNTTVGTENISVYYGGKSDSYTIDVVSEGSSTTNTTTENKTTQNTTTENKTTQNTTTENKTTQNTTTENKTTQNTTTQNTTTENKTTQNTTTQNTTTENTTTENKTTQNTTTENKTTQNTTTENKTTQNTTTENKTTQNTTAENKITENTTVENKTTQNTTEDNTTTKTPKSSDFSSATTDIDESNSYLYTANTSDNYTTLKVKISNIKIGDASDLYTYYYHISGKTGETNINADEWTKIDSSAISKNSDGTFSISLEINSKDLKNFASVSDADTLYMYLKEVASINNNAIENITTMKINNTSETTYYVNGIKASSISEITSGKDYTTASNKIPQTGSVPTIVVIMLTIFTVGVATYSLYNKNKNMLRGR